MLLLLDIVGTALTTWRSITAVVGRVPVEHCKDQGAVHTGALVYCRCPPCPESASAEVHLIRTHMYCNMQAPGCTCSVLHSTLTDALALPLPTL